MIEIELLRTHSGSAGTFGVWSFGEIPFAVSMEREWKDNRSTREDPQNPSCIPDGDYICRRLEVSGHKYNGYFYVDKVPNRIGIFIHKGNLKTDSLGCPLVGEAFEPINNIPGISMSGDGFDDLMNLLTGSNVFKLYIRTADRKIAKVVL